LLDNLVCTNRQRHTDHVPKCISLVTTHNPYNHFSHQLFDINSPHTDKILAYKLSKYVSTGRKLQCSGLVHMQYKCVSDTKYIITRVYIHKN